MKFQQSRLKRAYIIICYSCTYANNRPNLLKLDICNELVLTWLFNKMRVILERKIVSIEIIMYNCGYYSLVNCLKFYFFHLWTELDPEIF